MNDAERIAANIREATAGDLSAIAAIDRGDLSTFERSVYMGAIAARVERLSARGDAEAVADIASQIRRFDATHDVPAFAPGHRIWSALTGGISPAGKGQTTASMSR